MQGASDDVRRTLARAARPLVGAAALLLLLLLAVVLVGACDMGLPLGERDRRRPTDVTVRTSA